MAKKKTAPAAEARKRAREAKARLDAERHAHDQKVEDATTRFYEIESQYQDALAEAESLRTKRDQTILELIELERTTARVATLTGLERKTISAAKRAQTPDHTQKEQSQSAATPQSVAPIDQPQGDRHVTVA